jgi:dCMP deaminase
MDLISWDDLFMNMAYLIAMKSKDRSTHVGAVVVGPDHEIRSAGYNSFPRGINDNVPERQERPEKYKWFAHGEFNSVANAALVGVSLKGCTMYTNGIPCNNCALSIINSGIVEVVVDKVWDDNNYNQWLEEAKRTRVMFGEANIKLRFWEGELLDIYRFRNSQKI